MMHLSTAAQAMNAQLTGSDLEFSGVSIDSRSLKSGELFVAISGENFDGHDFIEQAVASGASSVLVNRKINTKVPTLIVPDTLAGLQALAFYWRKQFSIPIVAVTGSNGKTTVKALIASILNATGKPSLVTAGNFNNHIGLPLTLLRLRPAHCYAVIEIGMNHAGEIAQLVKFVQPQVALVNNAMPAHLEGLGSVAAIAKAKGEIFEGLTANGVAVLNADDPSFPIWVSMLDGVKKISFGLHNTADVYASYEFAGDHMDMQATTPKGQFVCDLNLLGRHNVMNALAAISAAISLDLDLSVIKQGLQYATTVKGRLEVLYSGQGALVINDTYNANPGSMMSGIDVLVNTGANKTIAVLGDMGELGESAVRFHQEIGEYAQTAGVDVLLSFGELMRHASVHFSGQTSNTRDIFCLTVKLKAELDADAAVLIKGSRSMRMERVLESLDLIESKPSRAC